MMVVAEVPSMEIDATAGRILTGISSKRLKSVLRQDFIQSTVSSPFLEKTHRSLQVHVKRNMNPRGKMNEQ